MVGQGWGFIYSTTTSYVVRTRTPPPAGYSARSLIRIVRTLLLECKNPCRTRSYHYNSSVPLTSNPSFVAYARDMIRVDWRSHGSSAVSWPTPVEAYQTLSLAHFGSKIVPKVLRTRIVRQQALCPAGYFSVQVLIDISLPVFYTKNILLLPLMLHVVSGVEYSRLFFFFQQLRQQQIGTQQYVRTGCVMCTIPLDSWLLTHWWAYFRLFRPTYALVHTGMTYYHIPVPGIPGSYKYVDMWYHPRTSIVSA